MSDMLPPVIVDLVANMREFKAGMSEAGSDLDHLGKQSGNMSRVVGGALLGVGAAGAALGIGVAAMSVKLATSYQSAMTQVQNTSGMSKRQVDALGNAFLNTMGKSEFSATELATAYAPVSGELRLLQGHVLSTGESMQVMNAAQDLAVAKGTSLDSTTRALVQTMVAFHSKAGDAAHISNELFTASSVTGQSVQGLAASYSRLHVRLGAALPDIGSMTAAIVDMQSQGISGSIALRQVSTGFQQMLDPTKKQLQIYQALNTSVFDSTGKFVGLRSVIEQLGPAFAKLTPQQQFSAAKDLFGGGSAQSMLQLIHAGVGAYDKASAAVKHHTSVSQAAAAASKNFHNELKKLDSTASDLGIRFGNVLLPDITKAVGWMATTGATDVQNFMKQFDAKKTTTFAGQLHIEMDSIATDLHALFTGKLQKDPKTGRVIPQSEAGLRQRMILQGGKDVGGMLTGALGAVGDIVKAPWDVVNPFGAYTKNGFPDWSKRFGNVHRDWGQYLNEGRAVSRDWTDLHGAQGRIPNRDTAMGRMDWTARGWDGAGKRAMNPGAAAMVQNPLLPVMMQYFKHSTDQKIGHDNKVARVAGHVEISKMPALKLLGVPKVALHEKSPVTLGGEALGRLSSTSSHTGTTSERVGNVVTHTLATKQSVDKVGTKTDGVKGVTEGVRTNTRIANGHLQKIASAVSKADTVKISVKMV